MEISKSSLRSAAERNDELRILLELELAQLNDPSSFVFLDESAADNKTVQRSQGWSDVGDRSTPQCTFLRGRRRTHASVPRR